ncbi:signal-transducing adaptor protein 1-like isoform X2 [Boleophthalmus pectinirostris]|uniref:signal-transducing adaptor protein 1-like isoform X2 n=1 Tax=Boleophthalmus pectinirostris TaxID=150288 RepID=UPI00242B3B18|nr:signal-transducing adaptor protein 1-like isoform X2 [Boleophthalmus pectinirostris]
MAVPPRVVHQRRATITALPLYYSGQLFKKQSGEKDFKKFYGELRGAALFLYEDVKQDTYTERLDLDQLKSMDLDAPFKKMAPAIFTLTTGTKEVKLRIDNADTGEEWRGYILTVAKKEIPSTLQLMPGQLLHLKETLAQEKKRTAGLGPNPPLPPRPAFLSSSSLHTSTSSETDNSSHGMPSCFFSVSRQEAEQMLETNPEYGNIILRPSSRTNSYGLTMRQLTNSGPVMKNYRVTSIPNSGFIIELDSPVKVPSLNAVISYVLEKTEYRLQPYSPSEPYDTTIEKPIMPSSTATSSTSKIKTIPKAKVQPIVHKDVPVQSPVKSIDNEYVIPEDECKNKKSDCLMGSSI